MGCLLFYTVGNMQSVTSNAVAKKISSWELLVEFQNGGSFTVPEDAVEVNINIGANAVSSNGSATLIMASMTNITSFIVSCNNNQRSNFSVTDNGRTFTNTGGDYRYMTVYYR